MTSMSSHVCVVPDALGLYLSDLSAYPPLSETEERELAIQAMQGDTSAKRRLIEYNLRLVVDIAKDYRHLGLDLSDLISEGNAGLIRAVETFDPAKGRLTTYATWWIKQHIRRALDNTSRLIRLPVYQRSRLMRLTHLSAQMAEEQGEEPSTEQIAQAAGMAPDTVALLLRLDAGVLSLDRPVSSHDEQATLAQLLPDPDLPEVDEHLLEEEAQDTLATQVTALLACLSEREQQIVRWRFGLSGSPTYTLSEIGCFVGLSKERVRQVIETALGKVFHQCLCKESSITLISLPHGS